MRVIIIGAGPAGLMAAGQSAQKGHEVCLLEKMAQPGNKLLLTGNGRCNLTNTAEMSDFLLKFNQSPRLLKPIFYQFSNQDLIAFFAKLGVECKIEDQGKVFPVSDKAATILKALLNWLDELQITILYNKKITKILTKNQQITGVLCDDHSEILADAVILATGGASYPSTGSTGDGYQLAADLGHKIIPISPSLVALETSGHIAKQLQGLSLKDVTLHIWANQHKIKTYRGEMIFTHFGLSGPMILLASRTIVPLLNQNQKVTVSFDFKPNLNEKELDLFLQNEFQQNPKKQVKSILKPILQPRLIEVCAAQTKIDPEKLACQISAEERKNLRTWLQNFQFQITKARSISEATITSGGIDLSEVNTKTMESKIIKNLYFAGEVLDLDADTGGYNLQAAFSTGFLAGKLL